jgi:hypothetical protein
MLWGTWLIGGWNIANELLMNVVAEKYVALFDHLGVKELCAGASSFNR